MGKRLLHFYGRTCSVLGCQKDLAIQEISWEGCILFLVVKYFYCLE